MSERYYFGIDLGTTNSVISVYDSYTGVNEAIEFNHKTLLKSSICDEDGVVTVGKIGDHTNTIKDIKSSIGDENKEYSMRGKEYTPVTISAMILKKLKEEAQKKYDGVAEIKDVTITVPAKFNHSQRTNTAQAAIMAGLNPISLINEPTSASLAYISETNKQETILVYDLGGGTFDASIVNVIPYIPALDLPELGIKKRKVSKQMITVMASDGDINLGGNDIDNIAVCLAVGRAGVDVTPTELEELRYKVQSLKESNTTSYTWNSKKGEQVTLTQDDIANATNQIYQKTLAIVMKMLQKHPSVVLDKIVLVGGSTKSEYIRANIKDDFPNIKVYHNINPDECVSIGAAKNTFLMMSSDAKINFYDISSDTVGVGVFKDGGNIPMMEKMLEKGTALPAQFTKILYKSRPDQTTIVLPVYQGEHNICRYNHPIGKLTLEDIPVDIDEFTPVKVTFAMDKNGILTCTAKMLDREVKVKIDSKADRTLHDSTNDSEDDLLSKELDDLITKEF